MKTLLPNLLQDVNYAVRRLWKSPGFTITAVLTLAIGIGVNTSSFSLMDAIVLRPLAVPDAGTVMWWWCEHGRTTATRSRWRWGTLPATGSGESGNGFEEIAMREPVDMSLTGAGDAVHVQADYTSPEFFSALRATPLLGRVFNRSETRPGANSVAVLSYAFWKSQFASDPGVLGRGIELDQHAYTVIGVMPKNMQYPSVTDFYVPFAPTDAQLANRSSRDYLVLGRLRAGVSVGQAQADLNVIAEHAAQAYPATNQGTSVVVKTLLADMNSDQTPLYFNLVQGATFFVLLVVCANIANLQFARGIQRRPEIAMRTALGAGRWRLMRQLLTENILLGLIGGAGGLLFAAGDIRKSAR